MIDTCGSRCQQLVQWLGDVMEALRAEKWVQVVPSSSPLLVLGNLDGDLLDVLHEGEQLLHESKRNDLLELLHLGGLFILFGVHALIENVRSLPRARLGRIAHC
jgi:hypothetical protein